MPRGKANFSGLQSFDVGSFRGPVLKAIGATIKELNSDASDDYVSFVEEIESAVWIASRVLKEGFQENSVQDIKAELGKLIRWIDRGEIERLQENIPTVSHDVWWAIRYASAGEDLDFNDTHRLRNALVAASNSQPPHKSRPREYQHKAASELTKRVLAALDVHRANIQITLTVYADNAGCSDVVRLLKDLGDIIGLVLEPTGWRDLISLTRKNGEDRPTVL